MNAIEFMPWTAWRGSEFTWGYDPFLFFSVENRYSRIRRSRSTVWFDYSG